MDEQYHDELDEFDEDEFDEFDEEPIEAYCVSCKDKVEIESPVAVWTSRGRPGTRGECPTCGNTVFRMGRTYLHGGGKAPKAVQVVAAGVKGRNAKATYIAADVTQTDFAAKLGDDLQRLGINVWVDDGEAVDDTKWSGGVHPALDQCTHLVVVLSSFTSKTASVQDAWNYFLRQRKPIALVMAESVDPPDELRSRPRFDFVNDYKLAFRGLMEVLSR